MEQKVIGVYGIVHIPTHRLYVGSSVDIHKRLKEHKADLTSNKHHCAYLQNAWNKYGEFEFEFKIGGVAEDCKTARELEQAFLDCYFGDCLFNSKNTAIGFGYGDASPAKKPDWHMKTVMQRLSAEERKEKYGKCRGIKRDRDTYVKAAEKRLADPTFRQRLSDACKGKRKIVKCPHCGLEGGGGNMGRYHFSNCKSKVDEDI